MVHYDPTHIDYIPTVFVYNKQKESIITQTLARNTRLQRQNHLKTTIGTPSREHQGNPDHYRLLHQREPENDLQAQPEEREPHQGESDERETYQGESDEREPHQAESDERETYQGESDERETYQGESDERETYQGRPDNKGLQGRATSRRAKLRRRARLRERVTSR